MSSCRATNAKAIGFVAADRACRLHAPLALRAAGLPDQAAARAVEAVWAAQAEHKCLADLVRARVPWAEIEVKISELQEKP